MTQKSLFLPPTASVLAAGPPIVAESTFRWRVQEEVFNELLQVLMDPTLRPRTFGGFLKRLQVVQVASWARLPSQVQPSTVRPWKQTVPQPQLEVRFWTQKALAAWPQTAQMNSGTF